MRDFDFNEKPELNITPLVDIMLVLLAILMVTTPAMIYEEKIALPDGSKQELITQKKENLTIRIDANRVIYINEDKLSFDELSSHLLLLTNRYDTMSQVFIHADKTLLYNDVMSVLKLVKEAGFSRVGLETNG